MPPHLWSRSARMTAAKPADAPLRCASMDRALHSIAMRQGAPCRARAHARAQHRRRNAAPRRTSPAAAGLADARSLAMLASSLSCGLNYLLLNGRNDASSCLQVCWCYGIYVAPPCSCLETPAGRDSSAAARHTLYARPGWQPAPARKHCRLSKCLQQSNSRAVAAPFPYTCCCSMLE
jgi:hypothetical protein